MPEAESAVVGTKHKGRASIEALAQMREHDPVRLIREPDNRYDGFAVGVHFLGLHCGYITRIVNPKIAAALDSGAVVAATVKRPPVVEGGRVREEPLLAITWRPVA